MLQHAAHVLRRRVCNKIENKNQNKRKKKKKKKMKRKKKKKKNDALRSKLEDLVQLCKGVGSG